MSCIKLRNCKVYGVEEHASNFWAQLSDTLGYVIMNMKYSALSFYPLNNIRSTMTQLCCIVFAIFFCPAVAAVALATPNISFYKEQQ